MKEQLPKKRKRYKKETLTHKSTKMYQKEGHNTITKRGGGTGLIVENCHPKSSWRDIG